jgi:hypothetical protein
MSRFSGFSAGTWHAIGKLDIMAGEVLPYFLMWPLQEKANRLTDNHAKLKIRGGGEVERGP